MNGASVGKEIIGDNIREQVELKNKFMEACRTNNLDDVKFYATNHSLNKNYTVTLKEMVNQENDEGETALVSALGPYPRASLETKVTLVKYLIDECGAEITGSALDAVSYGSTKTFFSNFY